MRMHVLVCSFESSTKHRAYVYKHGVDESLHTHAHIKHMKYMAGNMILLKIGQAPYRLEQWQLFCKVLPRHCMYMYMAVYVFPQMDVVLD